MKKYYLSLVSILLTCGFAIAQPTQPANPASGNTANCTTTTSGGTPLDQCGTGSTTFVTNFQGGSYDHGNNGNHLGTGAVWRFSNIGTSGGIAVNAEVTVNGSSQATLTTMDDNTAVDQNGVSVANFFEPVIEPDQSLRFNDRRGYVQFTITFFQGNNNFTTPITLNGLNFVTYDADGSYNTDNNGTPSQAWFRETRVAQLYNPGNPTILASNMTELVAYNYADPAATSWTGFAGGVYERDGISRCAEVACAFHYATGSTARNSITFRMGYDFKAGSGYNIGQPGRQYGANFTCFAFPNQITLPVRLLSFNGAYSAQHTLLNWSTENEQDFDRYEIERSADGLSFASIGTQLSNNSVNRSDYKYTDDLSIIPGSVFYYRLKMVDKDGHFTYSQVVLIKKDSKIINGVTINPNPIVNGMATVKMTSTTHATVELRIIDLTGRMMMRQVQDVFEGNNAITVDVQKLTPGIYTLQMVDGDAVVATKFSIIR